ncbi:Subtilisin-like protease 1, variant 2 [Dionaea muscipula]
MEDGGRSRLVRLRETADGRPETMAMATVKAPALPSTCCSTFPPSQSELIAFLFFYRCCLELLPTGNRKGRKEMIPWTGVSCCLSAAALYLLGRSSGRDAVALRSVTRVNQLKELALLLDGASNVIPLVVSISGRVGSDTPINCEYSGLRGVIVEETAEQHFLKHNDAGSWVQDSALMLSMSKEVPWYLVSICRCYVTWTCWNCICVSVSQLDSVRLILLMPLCAFFQDDGTSRVFVVGARCATGLELTVASEVFEESGRSLVRGTLDYLQGLKMLGVKRIERVLPTGTPLTVIGEAVKDDVGTIRIQRPYKAPFYVSPKSLDQLVANLGKWARWYKYGALGFTVFGIYLITKHAIGYILERRRRWELQQRVLAAAAKRSGEDAEGANGETENGSDSTKRDLMPDLCVICLEHKYNAVFVPCGHMCCCISCCSHLASCPLCRRHIEQVVKTFRH